MERLLPLLLVLACAHPLVNAVHVRPTAGRVAKRAASPSPQVGGKYVTVPSRLPASSEQLTFQEYWYDPRIHLWGNIGFRGAIHAAVAPLATWLIDVLSYSGLNVRQHVITQMIDREDTVLDLCCGTGFSSSPMSTGVDTSNQMLGMARLLRPDCSFVQGNAETFGETGSFDVVTVMFATHEAPAAGRQSILRNAARVARKQVIVVDIDPDFEVTLRQKPNMGRSFLAGEPYIPEYLKQMDSDVASCANEHALLVDRVQLIPHHVVVWKLQRAGQFSVPYWGI